ncbi:MAG: M20/M25/M40 family metallo-hydrolase [Pirellulaceae bacterium]
MPADLFAGLPATETTPNDVQRAERLERFDAARLIDHPAGIEQRLRMTVRYLASDALEGRGVGTQGIERAAEFIGAEFHRYGLKADHYAGSPFQQFARRSMLKVTDANTLTFRDARAADTQPPLRLREDFTPLSISGISDLTLPLVFVGYGITDPTSGYDDYENVDVRGKAVLILRNEPQRFDPASRFNGAEDSSHSQLTRKVANAQSHGAAAVLLCTDAATLRRQAGERGNGAPADVAPLASYDSLMAFNVPGRAPAERIPVAHVHRRAVEALVRAAAGEELADWETAIDSTFAPVSRELGGWQVAGRIELGRETSSLKNVVATIETTGPLAEQTVIVGAHYDHLGYGGGWGSLAPWTRDVHNGADDNASGTTVMIEVARQLAQRRDPLKRRVMFIAFTAEESGLIGSEYYVDHPLFALDSTVAMLNLDMVGYLRNSRMEVYGTGTAAEFNSLVDSYGAKYGLRITKEPDGYGPSDHASFHGRGVPVLHFFTGFHDQYHRPSDDSERLNIAGMRRITQMVTDMVVDLANRSEPPRRVADPYGSLLAEFSEPPPSRSQPGVSDPNRSATAAASPNTSPDVSSPSPQLSDVKEPAAADVGLGISGVAPSDSATSESSGMRLTHVKRGGWGARAGLRIGDQLLSVAGKPIRSMTEVEQLFAAASTSSISVRFRRGSVELETTLSTGK